MSDQQSNVPEASLDDTATLKSRVLAKNLDALRQHNESLADQIDAVELTGKAELFISGGEHEDINIAYDGVPLHDIDHPFEEAYVLFNEKVPPKYRDHGSILFMFGLGLGYSLKRAFVETKSLIIVYEPHLEVLRTTLEIADFSDILGSPRVRLVQEKRKVMWAITQFYLVGDSFQVFALPVYEATQAEVLLDVLREVKSSLYANRIAQQTAIMSLEEATDKALINMADLVRYPDVGFLHNQFKDMPGVVVSAGPSLDKPGVIESLKQYRDKLIIACVGQAAKTLDKHGIVPDFVVILESKNVANQLNGVSFLDQVNLVLLPQTHEAVFDLPTKRKMISFGHKDVPSMWLSKALGKEFHPYPHNGTVSVTAMLLLQNLGCKNIFLLGQDLAFPEGQMYSKDSVYKNRRIKTLDDGTLEEDWDEAEASKFVGEGHLYKNLEEQKRVMKALLSRLTKCKGWNGEDLYTYPTYDTFRKAFEYLIKVNPDSHVINCSEGGAYIEYCEHLPFVEALQKHGVPDVHPKRTVESVLGQYYQETEPFTDPYSKVMDQVHSDKGVLQAIVELSTEGCRHAETAVKELGRKKSFSNSLKSRMKAIQSLNDELTRLTEGQPLINAYLQKEIHVFSKYYDRKLTMDQENMEDDVVKATEENLKTTLMLFKALSKGGKQLTDALENHFATFPSSDQSVPVAMANSNPSAV
ncbi:MAG: motility associated factor glycosyltransferase family protein [Cyanobacteria bacterium HKST-UBA03]|nr:motility associated factor glycosyltransferase family protein [Cyanobacteria bacterium HKST-UBA03]